MFRDLARLRRLANAEEGAGNENEICFQQSRLGLAIAFISLHLPSFSSSRSSHALPCTPRPCAAGHAPPHACRVRPRGRSTQPADARPRGSSTRPAALACTLQPLAADDAHPYAVGPNLLQQNTILPCGTSIKRSPRRFEHEILALLIEVWRTMSSPRPSTSSKQLHHFCLLLLVPSSPVSAAMFELMPDGQLIPAASERLQRLAWPLPWQAGPRGTGPL